MSSELPRGAAGNGSLPQLTEAEMGYRFAPVAELVAVDLVGVCRALIGVEVGKWRFTTFLQADGSPVGAGAAAGVLGFAASSSASASAPVASAAARR